ncbi:NfeD family protein [Cronobacter turicensis]
MVFFVGWWGWVIIGAIFLLIELLTTTFFGLWMAIASLVPAAVLFIFPELHLGVQIGIWTVSMLVCAYLWVRISKRTQPVKVADGIVGQVGILSRGCSFDSAGLLILQKPVEGRTEWQCFSVESLPPDTRVVVFEKLSKCSVRVTVQKNNF